jgi:hypothetical protein
MRTLVACAAIGLFVAASSSPLRGGQSSPADIARKISGTWAFNQQMSPAFAVPGRGRGGALFQAGSAQPTQPRYPAGVKANPTNTEPTSDGASDLTPTERAERHALRQLGQVPPVITLAVTPGHLAISDDRGESECDINGRTAKARLFGAYVDVKCRWDKTQLRQEISTTQSKLIRTWGIDDREMLVLKLKVEGINQNTPEAAAFFDRVR